MRLAREMRPSHATRMEWRRLRESPAGKLWLRIVCWFTGHVVDGNAKDAGCGVDGRICARCWRFLRQGVGR